MDPQLQEFIANYMYLSDLRNVDPTNPITFEMEPDHRTFLMVSSFTEPTFSQLPYNVLWLVYDPEDPWYGKVYRRTSHVNAGDRKNTWMEITTFEMLYDEDQYYQEVSDLSPFELGIEGDFAMGPATTLIAGYVTLKDVPADADNPVVAVTTHPGFLGPREPTEHTHPDYPRTMVHINGVYTEDDAFEDFVGSTDTFVSFDYAAVPENGEVFFLTGNNPARPNEWYGEWRKPEDSDVVRVVPNLIAVDIRISGTATEFGDNTTGQLEADGVFDDNSRDINPDNLIWSIEPNPEGITVDQNGLLTIPDIDADTTVTVYADLEDKYHPGIIVRGLIVVNIRDLYEAIIPQSLAIVGDATSPEQSTKNYVFRVTYSDGSTQDITPDSASSSANIATFGTNGDLTSVDISADTLTILSATATVDGVTLNATLPVTIIAEVLPVSLTINGLPTVQEDGTYNYNFIVGYSDGTSVGLTNVDGASSSDTGVATFSTAGELVAADILTDTTITLTANHTVDGVSLNASLEVTVVAEARPATIEIIGAASIGENGTETYTFQVTMTDATTKMVTFDVLDSFTSDSSDLVISGADATAGSFATDRTAILSVSYTEQGTTVSDTHSVNLVADPRPASLEILGATSIGEGNTESYTFRVTMTDGSNQMVNADSFTSDSADLTVSGFDATAGVISADGTATLSASYTALGVTVTDTHVVNLVADPVPTSLSIVGPASIDENTRGSYTFTVQMSDGSSKSVSVTDFASTSSDAVVADNQHVDVGEIAADGTTDLSASYTEQGVTVSDTITVNLIADPIPTSLTINGPTSMGEQTSEVYTFTVGYSDGSSATVTADSFTSQNPSVATTSGGNTVNAQDINSDTTVTVEASYTEQGVTVSDTHDIQVVANVVPVSMEIIGPTSVDEESVTNYIFRVTMSDATTKDVTANPVSATLGNLTGAGVYTAPTVTGPASATLNASYTELGVTVSDTHSVSIANTLNPMTALDLTGPASINEGGETASLVATATFEDGSTSVVTGSATYQITSGSSYASLSSNVVTSGNVSSDQTVVVQATYTVGGVTQTATHSLTITAIAPVVTTITISGPTQVDEGGNNIDLTATGNYDQGGTVNLDSQVTWSITGNAHGATVSSTGVVTSPADVAADQTITVVATYDNGQGTVSDTHIVTIKNLAVSTLQAAWGYGDDAGTDVWPYDQAFIENLPNKLTSPILGQTLSLGPTNGHFYIAIPESELAAGKALFYHFNGNAQFSIWGGARWADPAVGMFGSTQPAIININGENWHVYRTDFAGLGGPDSYELVESNMPSS